MLKKSQSRGRRAAVIALAGVLACVLTWVLARSWPAPPVERATLASVALVPLWSGLALAGLSLARGARPGHARRSLFALHRRLGGALVVVAILLFGSGVGAVLDRSLASWQLRVGEQPELPPASEQALDEALAELLERHPELGQGDLALHPADAEHPWIQADFFDARRKPVRVDLDPGTGRPIAGGQGPLWVLREFHRRLMVHPLLGETALGVLGLVLGLILLSGLATRRWLRPRTVEAPRKRAPATMRTHQWLGVALLPFATLWAWTGALLGLTLIIVPIVGGAAYGGDRAALMHDVLAIDRPALDQEPIAQPSLRALSRASCPEVGEQLVDAKIHRILVHHPGHASATLRVDLEGPGLLARGSMTFAGDGTLRDCRALPAAGIGLESFMAAIALHYGEWDTPWLSRAAVDLIYVVLGSALVALAWLGGSLLARRREREGDVDGALRLRRGLTGAGLGLLACTVGLALLSRIPGLARSEPAALWLTVGIILAVALAVFTGELGRRRRLLLLVIAVVLILIPIVGWLAAAVMPGLVEAIAILAASLVLVVCRRQSA